MGNVISNIINFIFSSAGSEYSYILTDVPEPPGYTRNNQCKSKPIIVPFLVKVVNNKVRFDPVRPLMSPDLNMNGVKLMIVGMTITCVTNDTPLPLELNCSWTVDTPFKEKQCITEKISIDPGKIGAAKHKIIDRDVDATNTMINVAGIECIPVLTNDTYVEVPVAKPIAEIENDTIDIPHLSYASFLISKYIDQFRMMNSTLDSTIHMVVNDDCQALRIKRDPYRKFIGFLKESVFSKVFYSEPTEMKFMIKTPDDFVLTSTRDVNGLSVMLVLDMHYILSNTTQLQ